MLATILTVFSLSFSCATVNPMENAAYLPDGTVVHYIEDESGIVWEQRVAAHVHVATMARTGTEPRTTCG